MTDAELLLERRRMAIAALRSGKYPKAESMLTHATTGGQPAMCCIGVAAETVSPGSVVSGLATGSNKRGYAAFEQLLDVDERLKDHCIGLNDGWSVYRDGFIWRQVPPRSHVFIARFLELVWGVTL